MEPYFFLSYARVEGRHVLVKRFFEDLCDEVRSQGDIGGAAAQPFFDVQSIQVGQDWHTTLGRALGHCRAMVALYAPDFFLSEFCGREWKAFHDRIQQHNNVSGADSKALIPVLWEPVAYVPEGIAHIQYDNEEFGEAYHRIGLRRMLLTDPGEYRRVVRLLAQQVRTAAESFRLPVVDDLRITDEHARGPFPVDHGRVDPGSHVQFFVAARAGNDTRTADTPATEGVDAQPSGTAIDTWNPYGTRSALLRRSASLVAQRGFSVGTEEIGPTLSQRLDESRARRQVAILLVEVWAAAEAPYFTPLHAYDRENHPATGTVVPCAPGEADPGPPGKRYWDTVRGVFPRNFMRSTGELVPLFRAGVDHASFDGTLNAIVTVAQNQLFATSEPSRVPKRHPAVPMPVLRVPPRPASAPAPHAGRVPADSEGRCDG